MLYLGSHGQRAQERARENSVLEQVGLQISITSRGRGRVGCNFERLPDCTTTKLLSPRAPRTTSDATHWLHIVGRRKKEMRSEEVQVTPFSKGVFFCFIIASSIHTAIASILGFGEIAGELSLLSSEDNKQEQKQDAHPQSRFSQSNLIKYP